MPKRKKPGRTVDIIQIPADKLKPAEYNPRKHIPELIEKLKKSLTKFGIVEPVVINKDMTVIGGHQRLKAMMELGWEKIPCVQLDISKRAEKALNVALNQIGGEWDDERLREIIDGLAGFPEHELMGFAEGEIDVRFPPLPGVGLTGDDDLPDETEPITKPGDLYILGEHRLLCGDATKAEDVTRLMGGA